MPASTRFHSETARLSALLIGLFAASALVLGATVYWIADRAMRAELRDFISADVGAVTSGYRSEGLSESIEVVHQLTSVPGLADRILLQSRDGVKLAGNLDAMPPRSGLFEVTARNMDAGGRAAGGAGRSARGQEGAQAGGRLQLVLGQGGFLPDGSYLFVGENAELLARTRSRILGSFVWIIGITVALAAAGGMLLSAGFLKRIDAITRTCRAVVSGRFGERIPVRHSQAQLDRLSATINDMLDRIETLLESLRQVSTDIAHELRTPLTRLRQRLESARAKSTSVGEYELVVDRALEDCDAILAVFSALLRISQIESGMRLASFAHVDLTDVLRQIVEMLTPVAADGQQTLSSDLSSAIRVRADRTLLAQMFSNLVENAIRHAGRGATIAVECRTSGDTGIVRIVDTGPGIPGPEREKVFGRLYRLERSRNTPGSGLGLALVAAIAKLHQYTITLSDAGPGLCVDVRIPLQPV